MLKKLLTTPTEELGKLSRFAIFQIRLWRQCIRLLKENRSGTQAAALSYHTLFGIVPLAIVMLMVFQIFPAYQELGDKVKNFAYEQFNLEGIKYPVDTETEPGSGPESITVAQKIDEIVIKYIAKVNTGAITLVSVMLVIWAALGLLTTIERSFNNIWHVSRGRNFIHRMINYWALLTLGPLLLGLGVYVSTKYSLLSNFEGGIYDYIRMIVPYLVSLLTLFFLYFVLPNTRVNTGSALWGAVIAALLWTAAKYGFRIYVQKVIPLQAVYGILGIIPLAVFWIYITWLTVLFGLQLTYATQNLKTLDAAELARMRKNDAYFLANDLSVINMMACVMGAFERKDQQPVTTYQVCSMLDIPSRLGQKILEHMVKAGLLCQTNEPVQGYVPSTEGDNITLADIAKAVSDASFAQDENLMSSKLKSIIDTQRDNLAQCTLRDITIHGKKIFPSENQDKLQLDDN